MNYLIGRLPLLIEIVINGFFVVVYTLHKAKQWPEILRQLPLDDIFQHAIWVVPAVLFMSLISNFLKSESFEDFIVLMLQARQLRLM